MMKIFELMSELSKLPAGLEVSISGCMSVKELRKSTEVNVDEDGNFIYSVGGSCIEVDRSEKEVFLYF